MAKEFEKFTAEHKKLKTAYKAITPSSTETATQRLRLAYANVSEGEAHIRSVLVKARKAGVTGDRFDDFAKDKGFQEALKLQNGAAKDLDAEIKSVDELTAKAKKGSGEFAKLLAGVEKDLAKRKDSSVSKKDIDALMKDLRKDIADLGEATPSANAVNKSMRDYGANMAKNITKLIKENPGDAAATVESNELPHLLTDRNIKSNFTKSLAAARSIKALCDGAMEKAAKGDKAGALADLKSANEQHKTMKTIVEQYQTLEKKYAKNIDFSKDKKAILDTIAKMTQFDEASARLIRGFATTMKKAG